MRQSASDSNSGKRSGLLRLVVAGTLVGVLAGLLSAAFHRTLDIALEYRWSLLDRATTDARYGWILPVVVVAVLAALARWLVRRFAPETSGSGVQHVEAEVRSGEALARPAALPVKFVGGLIAIGSGFALGREGPTVQMAGTLASLFARVFSFDVRDRRALLAAGAGAGLAAAFNAPLAGAIFVFEELISGFELRAGVATLAACSAALATMRALIGDSLLFAVPQVHVDLFPGYLVFLVFGAAIGLLGMFYSRLVMTGLAIVDHLQRVPPELIAAAVGAFVGWIGWYAPGLIGPGETQVQDAIAGGQAIQVLAIAFVVRCLLGPLCYAPGLPGGLFAPLLIVGALAGSLFAFAVETLMPGIAAPAPAFIAVGMGAMFAAVVRAPLTGVAIVIEMTGAQELFIPLLTAGAIAVALPAALGTRPIYDLLRDREAMRR